MLAKLKKNELNEEFIEFPEPLGCHVPFIWRKKLKRPKFEKNI